MGLEVIIPTVCGRERYLEWCIRSCLEQGEQTRVLVSNNGGTESVRKLVSSFGDSRIRLVEPNRFLPMALHWEFAVEQAQGDVLTIIGDDDALVPGAAKRVIDQFLMYPEIECITHRPAQYYWPDYQVHEMRDRLSLPATDGTATVMQTKPALKRVLEFKAWYGTLPFIYHGFVRRSAIDRIRLVHGPLFKRLAPDVYSDLLLATFLDSYLVLNESLSVGGQGARSFGATFRLNPSEADRIVDELPEILKPILSPKSITLQLYEYGLMLREFWPQGFIVIPSWWRFTTQVFLEAMRCPEYKDEILRDLGGLAREAFPPLMGIAARLLIPLATFSPLTRIAAGLVEKRQKQQVASWETLGAARGIENVYAAAKYVHEATRSGAMVHQTECLPVA
jgi:hypothetical protein